MRWWLILAVLAGCPATTTPEPEPAPEPVAEPEPAEPEAPKSRVFFRTPEDGATVKSPVHLEFGVDGMTVKPAGDLTESTGHHHVVIGPAGVTEGQMVPTDDKHIHFGKGQTEADIELPPGEHKLTMQFADGNHTSYGDVMATTITITVEE